MKLTTNTTVTSLIGIAAASVITTTAAADHIWINEFHYDNAGADADEFVEVAVRSGVPFNAADYSITLYNGSSGASYNNVTLDLFTVGSTANIAGSSETITFYFYNFTANGDSIQNGAPDGLSLSDDTASNLVSFLSYEGDFTAADGAASGIMSMDIGVAEAGSEDPGQSLFLSGSGQSADAFSWSSPEKNSATPGTINVGQTFVVPAPGALALLGLAGFAARRRRRG